MKYLGIEPTRPKVAVFDFTGCEGCELQFANKEETLHHFLSLVDVVNFREISSANGHDYDVAFVEGAISRADEVERLEGIRQQAKMLVALGSCACFGGVNRMKNAMDLAEANRIVYGDAPKETAAVRPVGDVVKVDLMVPGCPVSKPEVERLVQHLVWGVPFHTPGYPVCVECKQHFTVCVMEQGSSASVRWCGPGATRPARPAGRRAGGAAGRRPTRTFPSFCTSPQSTTTTRPR